MCIIVRRSFSLLLIAFVILIGWRTTTIILIFHLIKSAQKTHDLVFYLSLVDLIEIPSWPTMLVSLSPLLIKRTMATSDLRHLRHRRIRLFFLISLRQ